MRARRIGDYLGRKVYKIPVKLRLNDSRACSTVAEIIVEIIARSPKEAANFALKALGRPETEAFAYGPLGGTIYAFYSWHKAISDEMDSAAEASRSGWRQSCLPLDEQVRDPFLA